MSVTCDKCGCPVSGTSHPCWDKKEETQEEFLERIKNHWGEPLPIEDRLRLETLPKTYIG